MKPSPSKQTLQRILPRRVLRLVCWWTGHHPDWTYGWLPCHRCEEALSYEQVGWPGFPGYVRAWWWRHVTDHWRKCSLCGQRFNRHEPDCKGDLPF